MARQNGEMMICDRCGKYIFYPSNPSYTYFEKLEEQKDWHHEIDIGDMCPKCSDEFEKLKEKFKNYERFALDFFVE